MIAVNMTPQEFAAKKAQLKDEQGIDLAGIVGDVKHGDLNLHYEYDSDQLTVTIDGGNFVERGIAVARVRGWLTAATPSKYSASVASIVAFVLCVTMTLGLTGCTPQQQTDFKTAVAKVAQYEPEVALAVDTLLSTLDTFVPQDALLVQAGESAFDAAAAELKTLCLTYAATPNDGTLASIRTTLTTMLSTNADQFLAAAKITNPASQASAKLAIGGVRTILLLMDGALQAAQTPAQNAAVAHERTLKLAQVEPYLNKRLIEQATGHSFRTVYEYETSLGY